MQMISCQQFAAAGAYAGLDASGLAMVERFTGIRVFARRVASMGIATPCVGSLTTMSNRQSTSMMASGRRRRRPPDRYLG